MFKWLFGGNRDDTAKVGGTKEIIVLERKVNATPERAFAVFVENFDTWWPRDLTWGKENLAAIVIEPKMNGRCYERTKDGAVAVWGTVLSCHRPEHIVIAWQIKADRSPEPDERTSSRLDLRFVPAEGGGTNLLLVHRDFPRHGDGWESYKAEMAGKTGWPRIVEAYAKAVG